MATPEIPDHACRIWAQDGKLFLETDGHILQVQLDYGRTCSTCGHGTLELPRGLEGMIALLRARAVVGHATQKIATLGSPTQYQIDMPKLKRAMEAAEGDRQARKERLRRKREARDIRMGSEIALEDLANKLGL